MVDHKSKADFNRRVRHSLKNIHMNMGSQRADTWKPRWGKSPQQSASESKFRKYDATASDELIIHDMLIFNPFFLKTVNNFNASPPFGLYDIF